MILFELMSLSLIPFTINDSTTSASSSCSSPSFTASWPVRSASSSCSPSLSAEEEAAEPSPFRACEKKERKKRRGRLI